MWYDDKITELTDEIGHLTQLRDHGTTAALTDEITALTQRRDAYQANVATIAALDAETDTANMAYMATWQRRENDARTSRKLERLAASVIVLVLVTSLLWVPSTVLFTACCALITVSVGLGMYRVFRHRQLVKADDATFSTRQDALDRLHALLGRIEGRDCEEDPTAPW
jgi:hypothetical protein